jgi:hypothetical protein
MWDVGCWMCDVGCGITDFGIGARFLDQFFEKKSGLNRM